MANKDDSNVRFAALMAGFSMIEAVYEDVDKQSCSHADVIAEVKKNIDESLLSDAPLLSDS